MNKVECEVCKQPVSKKKYKEHLRRCKKQASCIKFKAKKDEEAERRQAAIKASEDPITVIDKMLADCLKRIEAEPAVLAEEDVKASVAPPKETAQLEPALEAYENAKTGVSLALEPASFVGREKELGQVFQHLKISINTGGASSSLLITGLPGTGKTCTVLRAVEMLKEERKNEKLAEFDFIHINCMTFKNPYKVYSILASRIIGGFPYPSRAFRRLEKHFKKSKGTGSKRRKGSVVTVVLYDEIDCLNTKKGNLLYNICDWTSYPNARLVAVAISNKLTFLPGLKPAVASRFGHAQIYFGPYNKKEMEQIIAARLAKCCLFEGDVLMYLLNKVSVCSGDLRKCLGVCHRSIELAEKKSASLVKREIVKVTREMVVEALDEFESTNILGQVIQCFTGNEIVVLTALFLAGAENNLVTSADVLRSIAIMSHKLHSALFQPEDFSMVLHHLSKFGLVGEESKSNKEERDPLMHLCLPKVEFIRALEKKPENIEMIKLLNEADASLTWQESHNNDP